MSDRLPCPGCKRFHRGPRHLPAEAVGMNLTVWVPRWLVQVLYEQVPWGDRSAYVAALLERDLVQ